MGSPLGRAFRRRGGGCKGRIELREDRAMSASGRCGIRGEGYRAGALFVAADEPLLVFPSAAAAERSLEAVDAENGIYPAAYGPRGEPYSVRAVEDRVRVELTGEPARPDELRMLLLRYLEGCARETATTASVETLVAQVWKIESEFWQEHDPYGDRFETRIPMWGCLASLLALGALLYLFFR
jgi:hypothetical protein